MLGRITHLVHLNAKNTVRWLVIAASGCYGGYTLTDGILRALTQGNANWTGSVPFLLVCSSLCIAVAYLVFRRQYRFPCTLVSALAAVVVFGFLISLPKRFGLYERVDTWVDSPWAFIGLPLFLATLFIPFYGARWAYRRGQALFARFVHDDTQPQQAA
jgi:hypothetical protein